MDDMKHFLLEEGNSVMMGGDCSFNLESFLVTFITYRHAMIKDCKSSKSPVMIGPACIASYKAYTTMILISWARTYNDLPRFG